MDVFLILLLILSFLLLDRNFTGIPKSTFFLRRSCICGYCYFYFVFLWKTANDTTTTHYWLQITGYSFMQLIYWVYYIIFNCKKKIYIYITSSRCQTSCGCFHLQRRRRVRLQVTKQMTLKFDSWNNNVNAELFWEHGRPYKIHLIYFLYWRMFCNASLKLSPLLIFFSLSLSHSDFVSVYLFVSWLCLYLYLFIYLGLLLPANTLFTSTLVHLIFSSF